MDILIVNCDNTFHRHLAEEGFFQTLISDEKVSHLSPVHFMLPYWPCIGPKRPAFSQHWTGVPGYWLYSLSGKASEIASYVLRLLSDSSKGEFPTDPQPGTSNPRQPSDQPLICGLREGVTVYDTFLGARTGVFNQSFYLWFQTPKLEKPLCRFLSSSYVQAGDILRTSRRLKWFSFQAIHIARQAFHLIIRFNDFIGPNEPTEEQYNVGMELDEYVRFLRHFHHLKNCSCA